MKKGLVKKSVDAANRDGFFWAVMAGLVDAYIVPFALALKAGAVGVGVLRSLPPLLGSASQIKAHDLVAAAGSRKKFYSFTVLGQGLAILASAACIFLPGRFGLYVFIITVTLYTVFGSLSGPPWTSIMGDYIPSAKRGQYFGWRNQVIGFIYGGASITAGLLLTYYGKGVLAGFGLLFIMAGICRLISWRYTLRMLDARVRGKPEPGVTFLNFLLSIRNNRTGKEQCSVPEFIVACAFFFFTVNLAAPFFAVYMLQDLGFAYWQYMTVIMSAQLTTCLAMAKWGRLADTRGSLTIIRIAVCAIPLSPFLWCLSKNFIALGLIEGLSGVMWAAFTMGITNLTYEILPPADRTRYVAYYGVAGGLAQFAGAMLGGFLYERLPPIAGRPFITLLVVSGTLRIIAAVPFFTHICDPRSRAAAQPVCTGT